ncbi:hypothetical protein IC614_05695 [Allosphingosinicella flava]|uniref:Uncharacterized protein n=1 Tax=Allosphingosinicella flava TaxID=2771430 RepID=A0A7T2LMY6_9SPHN|nr:hypothetical protein [Sphingosinicella flava]QPQ56064.1 hypothetical protein IC614_05695 [Sphingosinicella flava]
MSYYSRYIGGDHIAVWHELRALQEGVRDKAFIEDARSVAQITMERVYQNLVRIEQGLRESGYRFGWDLVGNTREPVVKFQAPGGSFAFDVNGPAEAMASSVSNLILKQFGLGVPGPSAYPLADFTNDHQVFFAPDTKSLEQLSRFEKEAGYVPLSLHSFWTVIGGVDFVGVMDGWQGDCSVWNPLVINPPDELADVFEDEGEAGKVGYILGPDADTKGGYSGSVIDVLLPDSSADFRLPDGKWFVDELRLVTRLAGFPGFDNVDALPAELRPIAAGWSAF